MSDSISDSVVRNDIYYDDLIPNHKLRMIIGPNYKWDCELFGCGEDITLHREKPPNWFWRLMQRLILGNHWKRREEIGDEGKRKN